MIHSSFVFYTTHTYIWVSNHNLYILYIKTCKFLNRSVARCFLQLFHIYLSSYPATARFDGRFAGITLC